MYNIVVWLLVVHRCKSSWYIQLYAKFTLDFESQINDDLHTYEVQLELPTKTYLGRFSIGLEKISN